jgi:nicotinamide-nucleotide amidase
MRPDDRTLAELASRVAAHLLTDGRQLATAESCTGGWIAKVITDLPGSSDWFGYGMVSYSNAAKQDLLGVPAATLVAHGAVSEETVRAMAEGAIRHSGADVAVAVSGIAGPTGGSPEKPVGTVWFAWAVMGGGGLRTTARRERFGGDRETVRRRTVAVALEEVLQL